MGTRVPEKVRTVFVGVLLQLGLKLDKVGAIRMSYELTAHRGNQTVDLKFRSVKLTDVQRRLGGCQDLCGSQETDRDKVLVSIQYHNTSLQLRGGTELVVALGGFRLVRSS